MSAVSSLTSVEPYKLRILSDVNERQLTETVRSKVDHLRSVICANGMELNQIRTKKIIPDEIFVPNDAELYGANPGKITSNTVMGNEDATLSFRKGFLLAANKLYQNSLSVWTTVERLLNEKGCGFNSEDLAEVVTLVDHTTQTLFETGVMATGMFYPPRGQLCRIKPVRSYGSVPADLNTSLEMTLTNDGGVETIETMEAEFKMLYESAKTSVLVFVAFQEDRDQKEYVFHPTRLTLNVSDQTVHAVMEGRIELFNRKIMAAFEYAEKKAVKYRALQQAERMAIDEVVPKLKKCLEFNRAIAALPPPEASLRQVIIPTVSYGATMVRQKPKKGPKVLPAADDDDCIPAISLPAEPVIERPQVVLSDENAYNTFRTVMGADKSVISWNDVINAVKKIGFEVTQTPGSNTWKFKWKTKAWLRDEKTLEELADEFGPEETTVAATSMHVPHQGGLNTRGKLDTGRLSSFKKLLEESGFDLNCVTLKEKS